MMKDFTFQTPDWQPGLREQFPVTRTWAFFDSAYETGGADFLRSASEQYFTEKSDFYPGIPMKGGSGKGSAVRRIEETRELLADLVHAPDGHHVAFAANTCQAIVMALQNFPFGENDNVVVGDIEHVSVLYPVLSLKNRGVAVRLVHPENEWSLTAESLLRQVDEHTRFVVVSYVQSASGYRIDLKKLALECHKRGCFVLTDAIQALGFTDVNMQKLGVDCLVGSGYKGLLSVEGGGFACFRDELLEKLSPYLPGPNPVLVLDRSTGSFHCTDERDARKLEVGTLPFHTIYCLNESLKQIQRIGITAIADYVEQCFMVVYESLTALGYQIDTPLERHCHSMLVDTEDKERMAAFFQENGVFLNAGHGAHIRLAVAPFTSEEDIRRLLHVAKQWQLQEQVSKQLREEGK
ncbi:MAG: aminotransferase class V-fold PLP-dependent enzyme [Lachnospiraceae bacterium]|nr:aminotransferase class V-fold PLP-dependent enzyme [Lachnospiraceae bacterium]